jgi:hypothetical protein
MLIDRTMGHHRTTVSEVYLTKEMAEQMNWNMERESMMDGLFGICHTKPKRRAEEQDRRPISEARSN